MLLCVGRTTKNKVISKPRWLHHALRMLFWSFSALEVRLINYRCYWEWHVNIARQKQVIREKVRDKERWKNIWDHLGETTEICCWLQLLYREVLIGRNRFFCQIQRYVVIDIPATTTNIWVNALKKNTGQINESLSPIDLLVMWANKVTSSWSITL